MKKIKFIDTPGGWKYGFQKEMPREVTDIRTFLVENGYPQSEIDSLSEYFFYPINIYYCKKCFNARL